jgi:hypothetical protein
MIWRVRFAWLITKAIIHKHTHDILILISCPQEQWLQERDSMFCSTYISWLVSPCTTRTTTYISCLVWPCTSHTTTYISSYNYVHFLNCLALYHSYIYVHRLPCLALYHSYIYVHRLPCLALYHWYNCVHLVAQRWWRHSSSNYHCGLRCGVDSSKQLCQSPVMLLLRIPIFSFIYSWCNSVCYGKVKRLPMKSSDVWCSWCIACIACYIPVRSCQLFRNNSMFSPYFWSIYAHS